jgi:stage V sporulation protein D (sporulation-specific penicillin-binding protein)
MKKIVNDNGATVKEFDKLLVRQTVSEKTSEFIQKYMYQTVEAGTANGAKVEGYAIGGKTGTAQKLPRDAKTYVVSFLGAAPAINPEIVIYVMIDEPQNVVKQADSSIATTFASRIMKELLPALGIFPEGEIDYLLPTDDETTGDAEEGKTTTPDTENTGNTGNNENTENNENNQNNEDTENSENSENSENTEGNGDVANSEDQQNQENTQPNGDDTEEDSEIPDDASNTNEDEGENSQNSQPNGDQGEPDTESDNANQPEGQSDIPPGENEFNADALE